MSVSSSASGVALPAYLPALDGFRAISILLVLLSHAGLAHIIPGGLGVITFFIISGFLLTRQMILEVEDSGTLNIGGFYLRRILRLAPTLLVYIALFVPLLIALGSQITLVQILSGLFYFANYYQIFAGYTMHNPLPILWSLAVEEHYYILFPLVIFMFRRRLNSLIPWLGVVLAAVLVWRVTLYGLCHSSGSFLCGLPDSDRIFHGTDTIFDCILYGALVAFALRYHRNMQRWLIHPVVFGCAMAGLLATLVYRDPFFRETFRFSLQAFCLALVAINTLFGTCGMAKMLRRFLSLEPCLLLGRMSYALYLFHYGVLNLVYIQQGTRNTIEDAYGTALYWGGSFLCAFVCYALIEKPMLSVRRRFGAHIRRQKSIPLFPENLSVASPNP